MTESFKKNISHMLVLAGGFGTRLKSVVSDVPKPLAPIMGKPFLEYLLEIWVEQGVNSFTFLLHHRSEQLINFILSRKNSLLKDCTVDWTIESEPLGTGGAVAYAVRELKILNSFLIANADTWLGKIAVSQMLQTDSPGIAVVGVGNTSRYGQVEVKNVKVTRFIEKQNSQGAGLINAGLYHLSPDLFLHWDGKPFSLETNLFPSLVSAGKMNASILDTDFIDIGIPEDYQKFIDKIESDKMKNV